MAVYDQIELGRSGLEDYVYRVRGQLLSDGPGKSIRVGGGQPNLQVIPLGIGGVDILRGRCHDLDVVARRWREKRVRVVTRMVLDHLPAKRAICQLAVLRVGSRAAQHDLLSDLEELVLRRG